MRLGARSRVWFSSVSDLIFIARAWQVATKDDGNLLHLSWQWTKHLSSLQLYHSRGTRVIWRAWEPSTWVHSHLVMYWVVICFGLACGHSPEPRLWKFSWLSFWTFSTSSSPSSSSTSSKSSPSKLFSLSEMSLLPQQPGLAPQTYMCTLRRSFKGIWITFSRWMVLNSQYF